MLFSLLSHKGIIGSIEKLYNGGNYPVAIIIALFSVYPAIKH